MKRILYILVALLLLLSLTAFANNHMLVYDDAGLLTTSQEDALDMDARKLGGEFGLEIIIHTTNALGGRSPEDYANWYYDSRGFGEGEGRDGILFLLSMEDRDWYVLTNGKGHELLSASEIEDSVADILEELSEGNYYAGFTRWLQELPDYLEGPQPSFLLALVIGLAVAGITIGILIYGMNNSRRQHTAQDYLSPGSFRLNTVQDFYLYSTVTKTAKPKSNSSGGGGGGSRGGRGGKF